MNEFASNSGWVQGYIASEFHKPIQTLQIAKIPSDSIQDSSFTTFLASDGAILFPLAISSQTIDKLLLSINQQEPQDLIFSIIHLKQLKPKLIEGVLYLLASDVTLPSPGEIDSLIGNPQPIVNDPVWIILQREANKQAFVNFSADYMKPIPKRSNNPLWKYLPNRPSAPSVGDDEFDHEHISNLRRAEASPDTSIASFALSSQPISAENESSTSSIPNTQTSIASRTRRRTAAHRTLTHTAPSDSEDGSKYSQTTNTELSVGRPKRKPAKKSTSKTSSLSIADNDKAIEDSEMSEMDPSSQPHNSEMDLGDDSKDDSDEAEGSPSDLAEPPILSAVTSKSKGAKKPKSIQASQDLSSQQSQTSTGHSSSQDTENGTKKKTARKKSAKPSTKAKNKAIVSSSMDLSTSVLVEDPDSEQQLEEVEANLHTPPPSGAPQPASPIPFFEDEDSMFPVPLQHVKSRSVPKGIDFDIFQMRLQPEESDNESAEEFLVEDLNPHPDVMDIAETSDRDVHEDPILMDASPDILQTQTDFAASKPIKRDPIPVEPTPKSKNSRVLPLSLSPGYRKPREVPKPIEVSPEVMVANSPLNSGTSRASIGSAQPIPASNEETHDHGNSISTPQSLPYLPLTTPDPHYSHNSARDDSIHGEFIEEEPTDSLAPQRPSLGNVSGLDNAIGTTEHHTSEPNSENEVEESPELHSAQPSSGRSGKHKKKHSIEESSSSSSDEMSEQVVPTKSSKKKKRREPVGETHSSSTDSELDRYAQNMKRLRKRRLHDLDSEEEEQLASSKKTRVHGSTKPSHSDIKHSHKKKSARQEALQARSTEQSSSSDEPASPVLPQRNPKRRKRSHDEGDVEDPRDYYTPQQKKVYIPVLSHRQRRKSLPARSESDIISSKKSLSKRHSYLESRDIESSSSESSSDELTPYQPPPKIKYKSSERKFISTHKTTRTEKHRRNAEETIDIFDRQFSLPGAPSKSQATYGGLMAILLGSSKW